ncbi:DNA cytosine methyltransferase [Serratia quinivorans]|uniref:DNA cytosine methyltransferase n=1 Tax=Serratia quinivorans TaxID=137545 RepID=UPI002179AA4E|nr:DNA cytosine methyltransferase [Serratia quinivorans]CAI1782250.1 Modification methylase HaeIII [Serratia quinivorans]CAI1852428.1 Modification methylase HaeIII [Serratia quinivorans]
MSKTNQKKIIFSFFSGSGFLDLGFENNGFEIRFVNEVHIPFMNAYMHSREKMGFKKPIYGHHPESIEEYITGKNKSKLTHLVKESKNEGLVGFIGGPPCPDFSAAGKNIGHTGENGRLTKDFFELISIHSPHFFFFENVKGLWKTEKHRAFYDEMKKILVSKNYILTDYLANSLEFGVPQERDRIMLFGIKKSLLNKKEQCNINVEFPWHKYARFEKGTIPEKRLWPQKEIYISESTKPYPSHIENYLELTVDYWFQKNDVINHPNAEHFFKPRQGLIKFKTIQEGDNSGKSFKRLHRWRYSPTTAYGNNEVHLHPYKDRRLSAAEAMALQSLPKEFELPADMTLTNMFKTIGNGVPFLLSEAIAQSISDYINIIVKNKKTQQ